MQTDVTPQVVRTTDFADEAARFVLAQARAAIAGRGLFRLALAGGGTPRQVHLALTQLAGDLPWDRVQITFGDERCVPPDDEQSNFRMAKDSLLDLVNIPAGNIFRIRGEIAPELAAHEYEEKLAAVAARFGELRYAHDLILLGLGEDGHTASLFPGSPALDETARNLIPTIGPKPPPQRITMTFPLLNAARQVCFLVNDPQKDRVLHEALTGDQRHPAARVRPERGGVTWIVGT